MNTFWKPVMVGVDASEAAAGAAAFGQQIAAAAGTRCQLVHAAEEVWTALAIAQLPYHVEEMKGYIAARSRREIAHALAEGVPDGLVKELLVRFGSPSLVLRDVAHETGAELVILGGKRHSMLGRWFGGSTCHDAVRTLTVPVLVTREAPNVVRRVLAAVDLSAAAGPTLRAAERYAALFGAELRVMSVLEPLPSIPEAPLPPFRDYQTLFEEHLEREVWPLIQYPGATKALRHGSAPHTIGDEAAGWSADLVVLGSHGKGWVDRVLIGSVTERLLNHLPASLLIVPVGRVEAPAEAILQDATQQIDALASPA